MDLNKIDFKFIQSLDLPIADLVPNDMKETFVNNAVDVGLDAIFKMDPAEMAK